MKQLFHIFSFFAILLIAGCEEKPALFSDADGLYFNTADTSLNYSFAKYPHKLTDTIQIPVSVLGTSIGTDRPISVGVITATGFNAVEGVHYKVLTNNVIPANTYKTTIPVVVYRTTDLELNPVKFMLKLNTTEAFPGKGITAKQSVTINLAYIQKPSNWGNAWQSQTEFAGYKDNFGTWTLDKYKLILEALYDPTTGATVTEFTGNRTQPIPLNVGYVATVRNYIKTHYPGNYDLGGTGAAVLIDPANGQKIQVGPANY